MKKYILFLCLATFTISSCCSKENCDPEDGFYVFLYGFSYSEMDTIYVTGYKKGTAFAEVASAQRIYKGAHTLNPDTCDVLTDLPISPGGIQIHSSLNDIHEWKVYVPATNRTILIDNYGYKTYDCNQCRFRKARKGNSVITCSVDGVKTDIDKIKVYK